MSEVSLKLCFLQQRLAELSSTPAWSGQVRACFSPEGHLTLKVRNLFVRDWIRENFIPSVFEGLKSLPGDEIKIQFEVLPAETILTPVSPSNSININEPPVNEPIESPRKEPGKTFLHESLKSKYSFESFVVGSSNQFAHAAARAVSKTPGVSYNPLFVYGGVGLGKTHLLNAIGLELLRNAPKSRVIYVSAEQFMNELVYCLRYQKMGDFRKKYRDGCDLLLVDDVQFIAGKERTQEEFFHTFNHLHDAQKQIVLTSDKVPREIPGLEERLRSRFEWGLIADIQAPDLETRLAILKKKADDDGIVINDEVAFFLVSHIKSNIRELEGSLIRLNAFASLNSAPITIDLAKDVLKNVLGGIDKHLTVEEIQKVVADFYAIKLADLTGKRRIKSFALPRQIAMYLCRKHVNSSYPEIGSKFGGKDHSTVVHAFSKVQKNLETDLRLKDQVQALEQSIHQ